MTTDLQTKLDRIETHMRAKDTPEAKSTLTAIAALREFSTSVNAYSKQSALAALTEIASHFENV